jgi:hypothetical protein
MPIKGNHFPESARVLKLCNRGFFGGDYNEVFGLDSDNGRAALNSGVGVLDLEKTAIGAEAGDGTGVVRHGRVTFLDRPTLVIGRGI